MEGATTMDQELQTRAEGDVIATYRYFDVIVARGKK